MHGPVASHAAAAGAMHSHLRANFARLSTEPEQVGLFFLLLVITQLDPHASGTQV